MSKSKEVKEVKLVEITFCPKKLGCSDDQTCVYGIKVEKKGKKLVGQCDPSVAEALIDAGKAE